MAVLMFRSAIAKQLGVVRLGIFGLARQQYFHSDDKIINDGSESDTSTSNAEQEHEQPGEDHYEHATEYGAAEDEETEIKDKILSAALDHVPEHGWTSRSISFGAQAIGMSAMAEGMFPRGGGDLALYFIEDCNLRLADYLMVQSKAEQENKDAPRRRSGVVIKDALEVRLRMIIPFIDQWSQVMGLMILPQNAPDAVKNVSYMVDEIWYHAGDTSTDVNWYTKRGVLAAVYGATELYMVQDRSEDFVDTWRFLDRRFADIQTVVKMKDTFQKAGIDSAQLLSAAITTARNIAGLNSRSR